jgi:hypothetical protein
MEGLLEMIRERGLDGRVGEAAAASIVGAAESAP